MSAEPTKKTIPFNIKPFKGRKLRLVKQAYNLQQRFIDDRTATELAEVAIATREALIGADIIPKRHEPTEKAPDPVVVHKVARALSAGLTRQLAAGSAGVTPGAIDKWLQKGESGIGPFADAYRIIMNAESEAALSMMEVVGGAATGSAGFDKDTQDWKAAAWILERRFPHQYGRTVQETEHAVRAETEEDKALLDKLLGRT